MAITVGNTSNSGDPGAVTSYSWNHTCAASTNCLVVAIGANDSNIADRDVSGITYNGAALTQAVQHDPGGADACNTEIWYLLNPPTDSSLSIAVTHGGKSTDTAGTAIDLLGVDTTTPNISDSSGKGFGVTGTYTETINSLPTGSLAVGVFINDLSAASSISVSAGTERSEIDLGATVCGTQTVAESGGSTSISLTTTANCSGRFVSAAFQPTSGATDLTNMYYFPTSQPYPDKWGVVDY